jgi:hypothetical protein
MGINACILTWLDELAERGSFSGLSSVLELGPQDFFLDRARLVESGRRIHGSGADTVADQMLREDITFSDRQHLFYSLFGFVSYRSTDPYDGRADFTLDLNTAVQAPELVDLVADFGTTEHVFNVGNVFAFTHNSLRPGGIALKVLPAFGDNTHGFYNIHPTVYFDVARVNGYEMVDFRYVNNMSGRSNFEGAKSLLKLEEIRQELQSFAGCARLQARVSAAFLASLARTVADGRLDQAHSTVDYCFVALRKVASRPFVVPSQGVYLTEFQ